ncbi:DUF2239 family protein [Microbulbifer sp. CAU 1566]|uniref:DUF2239 family protein n=1 Tax=Microbulbifer sp. CAU 1566 TaxID=2933269 RepID=UPI002006176A|nr:DUF2239 family protein [Microbulbifer sp. CAU 1566]MCK7598066.1 DUF2239 family protein [Microbulbifer sp. CAU 1566]
MGTQNNNTSGSVSAFSGHQRVAQGHISSVALQLKRSLSGAELDSVLIFDDESSDPVEVDFSGSEEELLARLPALQEARGNGDSHDVPETGRGAGNELYRLLRLNQRQQAWLESHAANPAAAIKSLIDSAITTATGFAANTASDAWPKTAERAETRGPGNTATAREATRRSIIALGKSLPGYDSALAALQNGDENTFFRIIEQWPRGLSAHLKKLAQMAFSN